MNTKMCNMETFVKWLLRVSNALITFALILILFLMFSSCKSTKTTSTEVKADTLRTNTELTIIKANVDTTRLSDPCDDEGNLRPIFIESASEGVKTTIESDNGDILITKHQKADTVYVNRDVYKTKYVDRDVEKIITKAKYPKLLYYSLILNGLLLAWIFRKRLGIPL